MTSRMPLLSLGLLIVGFGGGYAIKNDGMSFALYHAGALGALSLIACWSGAIASKKHYRYWTAYSLGFFLPVVLGILAAYLVPPAGQGGRPAACGGSVSLVVALVVLVSWAIRRRGGGTNETTPQQHG